jgi:hypothetical protein
MTFKLFAPQKTNKKSIKQRSPIQPLQTAIAPLKNQSTRDRLSIPHKQRSPLKKNQPNNDRLSKQTSIAPLKNKSTSDRLSNHQQTAIAPLKNKPNSDRLSIPINSDRPSKNKNK